MKKFVVLLIFIFSTLTSNLAAQDSWTTKATMPTARYGLATAVVDGIIYAFGGAPDWGTSVATVEAYDPASGSWIPKADMPTARAFLSAAVVDNKIYVMGGINGEGGGFNTIFATVEMYDPAINEWFTKADIPFSNYGLFSTAVVNDIIYIIGGISLPSPTTFQTVWAYNPTGDTWEQKADMPTPRGLFTTSVVHGKIYAIGGFKNSGAFAINTVEEYNPATNTWAPKSNMPVQRHLLPSSAVGEKIYVIGGAANFSGSQTNLEYNPEEDTWTEKANMPTSRETLSTATVGEKIYAIGGRTDHINSTATGLTTVEEYYPELMVSIPPGEDSHPMKLMLFQNYPNPFGSGTTIEFYLPKPGFVSLKVFNVMGKEVATLVSERLLEGTHKYTWEAEGLNGGVYFYKLEMGEYFLTKKTLVLK